MELTERKRSILFSIVTDFVKNGEPVGSKSISDEIGVSSATVRNEMAELVEMGLLEQPHTSAGRVPSQKGYREYVDNIMREEKLKKDDKLYLDSIFLSGSYEPERLLHRAARALSHFTRFAALTSAPGGSQATIKAVQFVQTGRRTAMLILMSSAGSMKNRVFRCDFDLTPEILRVFFRVFNEKVTGKKVSDITPPFIQSMGASMGELSIMVGSALTSLFEVAKATAKADIYVSGQLNLLLYPEFSSGVLSQAMDFIEDEHNLSSLRSGRTDGVCAVIGSESGRTEFSNATVILSDYCVNCMDAGLIAVVGPMRMDYPKVMGAVAYMAEQTGDLLTDLLNEE